MPPMMSRWILVVYLFLTFQCKPNHHQTELKTGFKLKRIEFFIRITRSDRVFPQMIPAGSKEY